MRDVSFLAHQEIEQLEIDGGKTATMRGLHIFKILEHFKLLMTITVTFLWNTV
jgi:hypothetical protein